MFEIIKGAIFGAILGLIGAILIIYLLYLFAH